MTKSLGNTPRQDLYKEILIEYSREGSIIYVSGLDSDDFWEEFMCEEAEDVMTEVGILKKAYEQIGLPVTTYDIDEQENDETD